jgi:ligand-binding sensor domain-containing protein
MNSLRINRMIKAKRARKIAQWLIVCGILSIIGVVLHHSAAQESSSELVSPDANQKLAKGADDATLNPHRWSALTRFDGLPSDNVKAIAEDAQGILWFGTDNGLARYDGRNIVAAPGAATLPSQHILVLQLDARGDLWIGTDNGAARWRNERFEVLAETRGHAVTRIDTSEQGAVMLATAQGPVFYCQEQKNDRVRSAAMAGQQLLITKLDDGGLSFSKENTLKRLPVEIGAVTTIYDVAGELWVGTSKRGAFLLKHEKNAAKLIEHLTFENTAGGLRANHIQTIFRDREGVVWFGTARGVSRYDRDSFRAAQVSAQPQSNFVRALLSTSNTIWCGTNSGLFQLDADNDAEWREASALQGHVIYALTEDDAGAIWAASSNGLFVKTKAAANFARVATLPETAVTKADSDFTAKNPTLADDTLLDHKSQISNPKSLESVRALAIFRGQLFAAFYERGIERIDAMPSRPTRTPVLTDAAAQHASCFTVEGEQALWFGTSDGELRRYDGLQTIPVTLPSQSAEDTTERRVQALNFTNNQLWIGTSQGLFVRADEQVRPVIADVDVRALLSQHDATGKFAIWCATQNAGLIKLRPDENISLRFGTEQGLTSQQTFALAASEDEVWIGTNRGVVRHRPSDAAPRLIVNRLIADKTYTPDYLAAELSLPHTQRSFRLEVTGLSSKTFPNQFQYEFTIKGEPQNFFRQTTTHDSHFAIAGLATGPYLLTVRAISRDLVYSAPLDLRIRIRSAPFPWTTWLLASLLILALIVAAWAFFKQRRLAHVRRNQS